MLSLGTERLVGTRYGPNVPLAFDGVRAIVRLGKAKVNLFAVKPVTPGPGSFDDKTSSTKALWGAYGSIPGSTSLSRLSQSHRAFRRGTWREERHTIGARYYGASRGWHWNVEAAAQFGNFAGQRIRAWTLGTEVGRTLTGLPCRPMRPCGSTS
jgi:hypothetical protein